MKNFIFVFYFLLLSVLPQTALAYQDDLDGLLRAYVVNVDKASIKYTGVDYDQWSMDKRHVKVRNAIQNTNPDDFKTNKEKLAFWINAYNFFIIDLIIQKGERDSIKDLGGVLSPWERYKWSVNGTEYTLDNIHKDIIREFGDLRAHFAISCAAKSCPDLRNESYRAKKLNEQLSDQLMKTLSNKTKGYEQVEGKNTVQVTNILNWYGEDFNKGNIRSWLLPYFPMSINAQTKILFFNHDWSLNSKPK